MPKNNPKVFLKNFHLPKDWRLKVTKEGDLKLFTGEGLGFSPEFSLQKNLTQRQALFKAIGFKGTALSVLDITAGWAKDAFLISRLGCYVTAVESHPFVFHFVQEVLHQKELKTPHLRLILDDSLNYLNSIETNNQPDIIYMDPMFGGKKKSLSKKSLKILKELTGETKNKQILFDSALKKAKQRVVVKRHQLEAPLRSSRLCFFKGRSVCYDVFMPKKG